MRRLACIAILITSCGLPDRDNRNDPTLTPTARLRVVDLTDQGCALGPTAGLPSVAIASRGRCLALDASESSDPQGIPQDFAGYTLTMFVVSSSGSPLASPIPVGPATGGRALLGTSLRYAWGNGTTLAFEARLMDRSGADSFATAALTLTNDPPIAVADPSVVLPEGGYPWAPSVDYPLTFDGSRSYDPDGDPILLCWSFPGEEEQCRKPTDPVFARNIPLTAGTFRGRMRVTDGEFTTSKVETAAVVRRPAPWLGTPNGLAQLDAYGRAVRDATGAQVFSPTEFALLDRAVAPRVVRVYGTDLELWAWPDGARVTTVSIGSFSSELVVDSAHSRIWTISNTTLRGWNVADDVISLGPTVTLPASLFVPTYAVDANGTLWSGGYNKTTLSTIDLSGQIAQEAIPPQMGADELAVRPDPTGAPSTEVWALLVATNGFMANAPRSRLMRYAAAGAQPETVLEEESLGAGTFHWIDHDEAWIGSFSSGLRRIDAGRLLAGATLEEATLVYVPQVTFGGSGFAVDATGSLYHCNGLVGFRVTPQGVVESTLDPAFGCGIKAVDARGVAVYSQSLAYGPASVTYRSSTVGNGAGVSRHVPISGAPFTSGAARSVLASGASWVPTLRPSIASVTFDGATEELTTVSVNGALQPTPDLVSMRVSMDGKRAWGLERGPGNIGRQLWTFDLTKRPVEAFAIGDAVFASAIRQYEPAAIGTNGLYVTEVGSPSISLIMPDGTQSTFGTVPASEVPPFTSLLIAPLPVGGLCVGTQFTSGNVFHRMRIFNAAGTSAIIDTRDVTGENMSEVRAAATGVSCWSTTISGLGIGGTVRGWAAFGAPTHTYAGQLLSVSGAGLAPIGRDEIWVLELETAGLTARHLFFDPAAVSTIAEQIDARDPPTTIAPF